MTSFRKLSSAPSKYALVLGILVGLCITPSTTWGFEWQPPGTQTVLNPALDIDTSFDLDSAVPLQCVMLDSPMGSRWEPQLSLGDPDQLSLDSDPARTNGQIFFRGWITITAVEFGLLAVTASLPKDWTGWSNQFIQDGLSNLGEAYTRPPVWDDDFWFHNYIGHPYGGSVYYNTIRSQGASPGASFLFVTLLSTQWEYFFEALAERPSIQDLLITPITGSILGEVVHNMTLSMKRNGTSLPEKAVILVLNPMSVVFGGFE